MIPWFKLEPWALPLPLVGELKLQPFGLLAAIAILVGSWAVHRRARQLGLAHAQVSDFLTVTTVAGLFGAYTLNAALYFPAELLEALADPSKLIERYWGLSSYGGFFAGTLAGVLFCRSRGVPLSALADAWCYGIVFAWIPARTGCFVVHDHPGIATDFVLAVDDWQRSGIARHDLGLYEVLWALLVAPLCHWLARPGAGPRPAGYFVVLVLMLYGPMRFLLDFLRIAHADGGDARYLGLTPAQYASLAITIVATGLFVRLRQSGATALSPTRATRA